MCVYIYIYIYTHTYIYALLQYYLFNYSLLFMLNILHCSGFFHWILESIACFLTGFMRFTQNFVHSHRHSVEDIIWLQRAHSTFTTLYYLTCNVLRNNETELFERNIGDTTEHAVMLIKERQDEKAYFGVRYEFSCLIWFCRWIWNPCKDRVRKTGLALTISRLFHWYTTVTLQRSHSSLGLLRLQ